jgi:exosortase
MNHADTNFVERADPRERAWDRSLWVPLAVLAILIAIIYRGIVAGMAEDWLKDPNFSHGFLVAPFSALVVWQQRKELAKLPLDPSWFGLGVVAGSLAMLIVGVLGVEFFLQRSSLVFLVAGLILYFLGWRHFGAVLLPWAFLFLMIPIPAIVFNRIAFPLQTLAARMATFLLPLTGVPVLRDGNVIRLPTVSLEVAQACSGIRSLMSLGALAVVYGYFLEPRVFRRVFLALASIPIAVAANGLRVFGTGLAGYYWDPDKAEGFFHTFSGWVIFVASTLMLFGLHGLMRWIGAWGSRSKGGAGS